MSANLSIYQVADDLFEIPVDTPSDAQALANALRLSVIAEDIVAGLSSVCVRVHPSDADSVFAQLSSFSGSPTQALVNGDTIEIGIKYGGTGGPDLKEVCSALEMTEAQFIELHTARDHKVEMIGFTPGFAYLSGLPNSISIPRLSEPRARVPTGSVGISSTYTGIYALPGPGGWPLIGQTEAPLFSVDAPSPFLLEPGNVVRFKAT